MPHAAPHPCAAPELGTQRAHALEADRAPAPGLTTVAQGEATREALESARIELSEVFGGIAEFWGFPRSQGRIYGYLLLSAHPLDQRELRDRLELSAGSVSMAVQALVEWGAVVRVGRGLAAQTDLWRVIVSVLKQRERAQVIEALRRVEHALRTLEHAADGAELRFVRARLRSVHEFFELGREFLDAFVANAPVRSVLSSLVARAARFPRLLSTERPSVTP